MGGKWTPYEVAGAIFIYDEDTPIILGNPEGEPVFVIPGDDGIHSAWDAGEQACAAHNAALTAHGLSREVINDLGSLIAQTEKRHGRLLSNMAALGVITEEYHEVIDAIRKGEDWKIRAELLDLAAPCLRRIIELDEARSHG